MSWTETFDGIFFITLTTILTGSIGLGIRYCLKSRCEDVNVCWGCFSIKRQVELEAEEHIKQMELGLQSFDEKESDKNSPRKLIRPMDLK